MITHQPQRARRYLILPLWVFPPQSYLISQVHNADDYYFLLLYLLVQTLCSGELPQEGGVCELVYELLDGLLAEDGSVFELECFSLMTDHVETQLYEEYLVRFDLFSANAKPFLDLFIFQHSGLDCVEIEQIALYPSDANALLITFSVEY